MFCHLKKRAGDSKQAVMPQDLEHSVGILMGTNRFALVCKGGSTGATHTAQFASF